MKKMQIATLAVGLLPAALMAHDINATPQQQELIAKLPTENAKTATDVFTKIDQDAKTLVPAFAAQLKTEKDDADTTARYALSGLVWTVGHSGSDSQKQELARLIADAIAKTDGFEPKSFLIEQLQYLRQDSIVDALYPLMTDKDLGPRVIRTLTALEPADLADKALAALDDSNTSAVQAGLLLTLARLAPQNAASKIAGLTNSDDAIVRKAALDALAAIGDPASRDALKQAAMEPVSKMDLLAPARYLEYGERLSKTGHKDSAVEICREVADMKHTAANECLVGLSLTTLTDIVGDKAVDDLFKHVKDDSEANRATALENLNRIKSGNVTERMTQELEKSPDPEVTLAVLRALGNRGDAATLPAVMKMFSDKDAEIASTAVEAAGEIDRSKALPAILDALKSVSDKDTVEAAKQELLRTDNAIALPAIAKAIPTVTPEAQVALVEILGTRQATSQKDTVFTAAKSDNAKVRAAAYEALGKVAEAGDLSRLRDTMLSADKSSERKAARNAFVAAAKTADDAQTRSKLLTDPFESASPEGKTALLQAMAALADKQTLDMVVEQAKNGSDKDTSDAAVRALSEWQSMDALPALKEIADKSKSQIHQVLAVRGIARLAGEEKDKSKQAEMLGEALDLAKRDDERATIISQLSDIHSTTALEAISPYVDRKGIAKEAAKAAIKIAMPDDKHDGLRGAETIETMERALPAIGGDRFTNKDTEQYIYSLIRDIYEKPTKLDDDGFEVLFNGEDMTGWCGDIEGYSVEDGALVCRKDGGGKLFTEKQYSDFVMRFEFKIQAGGNNGVGVRAPLYGDAAYSGMEIQILDDKDPQYKDIKPYQHHGSVYGIAAADKPADLKIGEWNNEEIRMVGRNVKVTVNGKVITDVNLDEATENGIVSHRPHPGVKRNRGHIGFLGHHHRAEFRNVRMKAVADDNPPEGYTAAFNGENLDGWKGLVTNPVKRANTPKKKLKKAQEKADASMHEHWKINNGVLFFDGKGSHLCTTKDYRNFDMYVDWCIPPGGDNGIYLRGSPQVQIWDPRYWPEGSGGLYNNQESTSSPLVVADMPVTQWNRFHIKMVDEKVTVYLNDKLVVDNQTLENYWDRKQPIFSTGQIELQSHGSPAWFKNVYIKALPD